MSKPTPKTLVEAIENGLKERGSMLTPYQVDLIAADVDAHTRDFLAQRFGAAFLKHPEKSENEPLNELWNMITRKEE